MGERLAERREAVGMSRSAMRLFGLILLALGLMSRGILQTRVLGVGSSSGEQLLQVLDISGGMTAAAVALALQALESCAVPIFAVLLIDGFENTKNFRGYILRTLILALICEIPYNFAVSAKFWDPASRNPAFATVLCLAALYLYRHYAGADFKNALVKIAVFFAAVLWAFILRIQYGIPLLIVVSVLWMFRARKALRNFIGAAAAICCCVGNPLYMFSPFGFLIAHFYNGEEGNTNRIMQYALYPLLLILVGLAGTLLF